MCAGASGGQPPRGTPGRQRGRQPLALFTSSILTFISVSDLSQWKLVLRLFQPPETFAGGFKDSFRSITSGSIHPFLYFSFHALGCTLASFMNVHSDTSLVKTSPSQNNVQNICWLLGCGRFCPRMKKFI